MKKIAVIGDKESVLSFRAVGFTAVITEDEREAEKFLRQAAENDYSIVFITEQLMAKIPETVNKIKSDPELAVIAIPGKAGSLGIGLANIKSAVEKAVGADILK